jgi:hypothetical protein
LTENPRRYWGFSMPGNAAEKFRRGVIGGRDGNRTLGTESIHEANKINDLGAIKKWRQAGLKSVAAGTRV